MKKLALVVALMGSFSTAHATGLSVSGSSANFNFSNYDGEPVTYTGARSVGFTGTIYATSAGVLEAVYLGQESDHFNIFNFSLFNGISELNAPGQTITKNISSSGVINFAFTDTTNIFNQYYNGSNTIAILDGAIPDSVLNNYGPFDYILGFNDSGKKSLDKDYDDFVVGLRFTPSAVPVPAALPLMATALGLFGFGASRRRL